MADANPFDQQQTPTDSAQPVQAAPQPPVATVQPAQPVQYVVMEKSNVGITGWLTFFIICISLLALGSLAMFFGGLVNIVNGIHDGATIVMTVFSPLVAAASIVSIVFIAMQKKLGKWLAIGTFGLNALFYSILYIATAVSCNAVQTTSYDYYTSYTSTSSCGGAEAVVGVIAGILLTWVIAGLLSLYFFLSKRVKATLVK